MTSVWCLQVSEDRLIPSSSSVLHNMPLATPFMLFILCKEAGAKQHIYSCQALFLLLMLQSYSDATSLFFFSIQASFQKHTFTPNKSLLTLDETFCMACLPFVLFSITRYLNSNNKYWGRADTLFLKLYQRGCTGNEEAKWAIALHGLSQLNQSHYRKNLLKDWRYKLTVANNQ